MSNEIDRLMSLDPLDLTVDDLTKVVAYQRKMRGMAESGIKPEKQKLGKIEGSALLEKIRLVAKQPTQVADRRD